MALKFTEHEDYFKVGTLKINKSNGTVTKLGGFRGCDVVTNHVKGFDIDKKNSSLLMHIGIRTMHIGSIENVEKAKKWVQKINHVYER